LFLLLPFAVVLFLKTNLSELHVQRAFLRSMMIFLFVFFLVPAFSQSPGTVGDPLVSKSYIDHFFKFRSVVLPAKTKISASPGALIIVRSGLIKLEAAKGKGLVDLTAGKEIQNGEIIPLNHLIIIPDSAGYILNAEKLSLLLASCLEEEKP
jgi:hypothetical protein